MKTAIVILGAITLMAAGCNKQAAQPAKAEAKAAERKGPATEVVLSADQQKTAQIETEQATASREPEMLRVKGRIAIDDNRTWRQGVRTMGSVTEVYVGLGDRVRKSQILARYHADEVRDQRAVYRAAVSERERALSSVAQAQRNLDRAKRLLELKAGSAAQVEMAQQEVVTAEAAVRKAGIEVDRTKDLLEDDLKVPAEPTPNRRDETEDQVPIISPADGFVLERNVTRGRTVEPNSVTFVIGDLSMVWMLASVKQEDLSKLRTNQSAWVLLGERRIAGKITNLGQQFDPETRQMQVRIELPNPNGMLRPEMLADAEIPVGGGKPVVSVPSDAVQQVNGQDVVFEHTAEDRFSVRPVRIGEPSGGRTPILEGLRGGEKIAVHGTFALKSQLLKASLEAE